MNLALLLLNEHFCLQLLPFVITADVGVNFGLAEQSLVHGHQLLRGKHPAVQLVELWLNLRWLQVLLLLWVRVILDGHLFVTGATDGDAELEVGSDLAKLFALGVAHDDPLVHESVILTNINRVEIELVVANQRVLEEALVHELDLDLTLLKTLNFDILRFKEDVLVPDSYTGVVQVVECLGELALIEAIDLNDWVDDVTFGHV